MFIKFLFIGNGFSLIKYNLFLFVVILTMFSCKKRCGCELVVYDSTFETNYEWVESDRLSTDQCENDTMTSTFLDSNSNISYVRSIIECLD